MTTFDTNFQLDSISAALADVTGLEAFTLPIGDYMSRSKIVGLLQPDTASSTAPLPNTGAPARGCITVIPGAVSNDGLQLLIERCRVDRDLLRFHFRSSDVFQTGTLPSRAHRYVTVRFITIGSFVQTKPHDIDEKARSRLAQQLDEHHRDCLAGERNGFECFRALNTHGRSFFTVEQQATFSTYDTSEQAGDLTVDPPRNWSGVLLSDIGRQSALLPWNLEPRAAFKKARFLSVGSSDLHAARFDTPLSVTEGARMYPRPNPFLSRSHDDEAMSKSDQHLCATEPFVFTADLLETSALCWDQSLNFLRDNLQHLPRDSAARVQLLSETKALADRATRYFREMTLFINTREDIGWESTGSKQDVQRVKVIAQRLQADFESLGNDSTWLSQVCQDTISITMNEITILESQKALAGAGRIHMVTYLAFVFIPVTLLSSIFGMNVVELDSPKPSMSLFWIISSVVVLVSILIPVGIERYGLSWYHRRTGQT